MDIKRLRLKNLGLIIFIGLIISMKIASAGGYTEVIAGVDYPYTFLVTNSTNSPLSGAVCSADTFYPNGTMKDTNLSGVELNVTAADGTYYFTFGSTYSANESGLYTLCGSCTSNGITSTDCEKFAIVKNQYSFIDTMWEVAVIMGSIAMTFLLMWISLSKSYNEYLTVLFSFASLFMGWTTINLVNQLIELNTSDVGINTTGSIGYSIYVIFFSAFILIFGSVSLWTLLNKEGKNIIHKGKHK